MNINIYCDESCHLLNDHIPIMTFGAIQYPANDTRKISKDIARIKEKFNCLGELKWTKVSPKNIKYYFSLIDYFISDKNLHFRSLIVHNKNKLDHVCYNDSEHDNFYYKMYFYLLRNIIENKAEDTFKIFLDIKDTKGSLKIKKLHEVLNNNFYDFLMNKIKIIQQINSKESNILQLCDFLLGAVTYKNRSPQESKAKLEVAEYLEKKIGFNLEFNTPPWEEKFNLFHFSPREN